jgi:hypothetical protein
MAVRLRPDGTWEFDTLDEAVEFERRKTSVPAQPAAPTPRPSEGREGGKLRKLVELNTAGVRWSDQAHASKGLKLLAAAGAKGIDSDTLAADLGLDTPRGLSGVAQGMRRRISAVSNGTPVNKILWTEGEPGELRWFVDPQKLKELGLV